VVEPERRKVLGEEGRPFDQEKGGGIRAAGGKKFAWRLRKAVVMQSILGKIKLESQGKLSRRKGKGTASCFKT